MCYNDCTDIERMVFYMARAEKFKRNDLVPVLKEGFRDLKEYRNNVDETRTGKNYTYGCQTWKEVKTKALERESEIMDGKINKQSKPLFSWVVTYPQGRTSVSEHDFFEAVRDYMVKTYKKENVMAVCVHMDETTPHCHCYIVPEVISRKTGERTVSVGSLLDRKHLKEFHKDFNDYMFERFGERNLIKKPEDEKAEENVPMMELKRRTLKAKNETLTAGNKELETQRKELTNSVSTLENELRMLEEKRKQKLERSQKLIEAEISDFRDKRVKEIEKELEPLEVRKKRMEKHIEELEVRNKELEDYQTHLDDELVQVRKHLNKMRQAFFNLWDYLKDWQRLKVKEEFKNAHVQQEKNDDWDIEM